MSVNILAFDVHGGPHEDSIVKGKTNYESNWRPLNKSSSGRKTFVLNKKEDFVEFFAKQKTNANTYVGSTCGLKFSMRDIPDYEVNLTIKKETREKTKGDKKIIDFFWTIKLMSPTTENEDINVNVNVGDDDQKG